MIRAHRVNATAQDDASLVSGWNIAPNLPYILRLLPGASSCGVLIYDDANVLIASGAALAGTDQPCILTPQTGQTIGMVDAEIGWHLLLTTTGTESQREIRISPAVDLPDEIHPAYADDDMALARATAAIDEAAHYRDDVTVSCPLGLSAGLGDIVSVPVDGVTVVGQVESITWTATPDGATEQAVVRRHVAIAPEPFIEPVPIVPPAVADDVGATDADTATTGNVLTNDVAGLTVVAVNGLTVTVGVAVAGSNGGTFTITANGAWVFDPAGEFALLTGAETADTSVTYYAGDGVGEAMATLTITVSAAAGGTLWTPAEITGAVWVDADTVTLDGSAVTTITDKIGGTITATQGTAGARPALVADALNGHDVIQFDGGDWLSFGTALGRPANWTVFAVAMLADITSATVIGSSPATAATQHCWGNIEASTGKGMYRYGNGSAFRYGYTTDVVLTANNWFCECDTFSAGGPTPLKFVNGYSAAVGTTGGTATTCGGDPYDMSIGRLGAYNGSYMGANSRFLGAVIVPTALDLDARQKLEGYYMHRAGLTSLLPSDHPYKSSPPTI